MYETVHVDWRRTDCWRQSDHFGASDRLTTRLVRPRDTPVFCSIKIHGPDSFYIYFLCFAHHRSLSSCTGRRHAKKRARQTVTVERGRPATRKRGTCLLHVSFAPHISLLSSLLQVRSTAVLLVSLVRTHHFAGKE